MRVRWVSGVGRAGVSMDVGNTRPPNRPRLVHQGPYGTLGLSSRPAPHRRQGQPHTSTRSAELEEDGARHDTTHAHSSHASLSTLRRGEGALSGCMRRCGETGEAAAFGAGLPGPRRNARMLRLASGSAEQESCPEASARWGRRRCNALRLRRRRCVAHLVRSLVVERLDVVAALAGRGRRGSADGRVAHRERDHHGAPKPHVEEHHVQHASQSTSTRLPVVRSTP